MKNRIAKYILYALGEVVLVVIGILLALQINNWNEARKSRKVLKSILRTVSYDLATDTIVASDVIKYYEESIKNSNRIIEGEITKDNYKECPACPSLVTLYRPMFIQKKGFELLKTFSNDHTSEKDSLITDITQFYTIYIQIIEKSNERMEKDVLSNLESFKKYPWFVNWTKGTFNEDMVTYFTESNDYKTKVAAHNVLASNNHLRSVQGYKLNAEEILKQIEARIGKEEQSTDRDKK
ncbi:hypothetical protein GWK08_18660 [Leptobacterium flavescens]|uniref:Uncharacterized protein n=1 Tax=Leptobacterium flavescens TaxID=472055 RepID=A0A6P0UXR4_9FLAO|nr:DUF6090 family protein [Leptobacterium flavescens]NER15483.1 hypothetical protein [Leptobacterium flavescens]